MIDLEKAIKRLLKEKGITMTDVINSVGMSQAGFYKMLNSNSVKVETLEKIASFLKVDIRYFFHDFENETIWLPPPDSKTEARKIEKKEEKQIERIQYKPIDKSTFTERLVSINVLNYALFDLYLFLQKFVEETEKYKDEKLTIGGETTTVGEFIENFKIKINDINGLGQNI